MIMSCQIWLQYVQCHGGRLLLAERQMWLFSFPVLVGRLVVLYYLRHVGDDVDFTLLVMTGWCMGRDSGLGSVECWL